MHIFEIVYALASILASILNTCIMTEFLHRFTGSKAWFSTLQIHSYISKYETCCRNVVPEHIHAYIERESGRERERETPLHHLPCVVRLVSLPGLSLRLQGLIRVFDSFGLLGRGWACGRACKNIGTANTIQMFKHIYIIIY